MGSDTGASQDGRRNQGERSPTGMHGLNLAPRTVARFLLRSPPPPLGDRGSKLRSPSADLPGRSRRLEAAFRSPAPTARFQAAATGSTFPAYLFGCRAEPSPGPFGPKLPARLVFARRNGSQPLARCLGPAQHLRNLPRAAAPHRDCRPYGS
jgi:hypothetical protein